MELENKQNKPEKKGKSFKVLKFVLFCVAVVLIFAIALIVVNVFQNKCFETSYYYVKTEKAMDNIRIIELSDLHNAQYGENNIDLINKIDSLNPDLIFYCGDMMNCGDSDYSKLFDLSDKLSEIAPIYACFGNNEYQHYLSIDKEFKEKIAEHNVTLLSNETLDIRVKNTKIQLVAVSEGVKQYDTPTNNAKKLVESLEPTDSMRICLTHYPELFLDKLLDKDMNLAFTGHAHGGLIRIPYIGGLYSEGEGLLPKLTEGIQTAKDGTRVVISRGLGNSGHFMRINNKPELVVVDLNWY